MYGSLAAIALTRIHPFTAHLPFRADSLASAASRMARAASRALCSAAAARATRASRSRRPSACMRRRASFENGTERRGRTKTENID